MWFWFCKAWVLEYSTQVRLVAADALAACCNHPLHKCNVDCHGRWACFPFLFGRRFKSLAPGRRGSNHGPMLFKLIIQRSNLGTHSEIGPRWMSYNLTNEMSTLVQVMTWYRRITRYYLSQCWPILASLGHNQLINSSLPVIGRANLSVYSLSHNTCYTVQIITGKFPFHSISCVVNLLDFIMMRTKRLVRRKSSPVFWV